MMTTIDDYSQLATDEYVQLLPATFGQLFFSTALAMLQFFSGSKVGLGGEGVGSNLSVSLTQDFPFIFLTASLMM